MSHSILFCTHTQTHSLQHATETVLNWLGEQKKIERNGYATLVIMIFTWNKSASCVIFFFIFYFLLLKLEFLWII